jgi:hypothetical protein
MLASGNGHAEVVKLLTAAKANVHTQNKVCMRCNRCIPAKLNAS